MVVALTCALLIHAAADEVTPAQTATIERDQAKAQAQVSKKYGDKKPSELTPDERRDIVRERAAADQKVLNAAGVDAKTWATSQMRRNREQTRAVNEAKAQLAKADAEAAKPKVPAEPQGPVEIQQGFREDQPTVLEEKPGAAPIVETALPQEALDDQKAAEDASKDGETAAPAAAEKAATKRR